MEIMNGAVPNELQNEMMEQIAMEDELISPVSWQSEELRKQAVIDMVGGNPNKVPKGYVLLLKFVNSSNANTSEWMTVNNREELRQTIIDVIKGGESIDETLVVDESYVLPEGWTIDFGLEWTTVYDVMKHIEPYFDDPMYEPFDIEDYV